MSALDIRFAEMLRRQLIIDVQETLTSLGSGSQVIREDAAATGMNCARFIGLIQGIENTLRRIDEIEDVINGRGPTKEK